MNTLGPRIRRARKALGLSQESLAERLGVSSETVSQWETGAFWPKGKRLPDLAAELQLNMDELIGRTGSQGVAEPRIQYAGPEGEVLEAWRTLPPPDRALALRLIRGLQYTGGGEE